MSLLTLNTTLTPTTGYFLFNIWLLIFCLFFSGRVSECVRAVSAHDLKVQTEKEMRGRGRSPYQGASYPQLPPHNAN